MSNVPKLRFGGFTNKWIVKRLQELCSYEQGVQVDLPLQSKVPETGLMRFIRIENYTQKSSDFRYIPENLARNKKINEEEIAVVRYGATAGFIGRGIEGVLANNLFKLKPNLSKVDINYLFHFLKSHRAYQFFQSEMAGGAMPALSFGIVDALKFPITSINEQQKIAAFLTAVDIKIEQLTQKEALLKQYKKGVMQKIFSQEIRFKADDGSEFPEWEEDTLGDIVSSLSNGLSLEQNTEGSGYKVTRIETISDARINLSKVGYVKTKTDITSYKLNKGDMLFSNINSVQHIGKIAYVDKDFDLYHGMNLLRLVISTDHDSKYLYYVLTSSWYKRYFERVCNKAVNQASINQTDLRKTPLVLPSKQEQTKIALFLSVLDKQADQISLQLEAVKTFKKGLLQQMFV